MVTYNLLNGNDNPHNHIPDRNLIWLDKRRRKLLARNRSALRTEKAEMDVSLS